MYSLRKKINNIRPIGTIQSFFKLFAITKIRFKLKYI